MELILPVCQYVQSEDSRFILGFHKEESAVHRDSYCSQTQALYFDLYVLNEKAKPRVIRESIRCKKRSARKKIC